MVNKIRTESQYKSALALIDNYLEKATKAGGFDNLSKEDKKHLECLSASVEDYEDNVLKLMPLPVTLKAVVNHKIQELKINQAEMAEMLGLTAPKLSQILNGKRQPDVPFLKALHSKLGISGDFLLETV